MKKLPIVMLSLMTLPAFGQSILSSLNQHQSNLRPSENSSSNTTTKPDVKPSEETVVSGSAKCEENDQTSLPLAYITSLIQEKDGKLDIIHNPGAETVSIKSPEMISNCSSMIQWELKRPEIQGQKAYAIEAKIKNGDSCSDDGCSYKVAVVENGEFKEHKEMKFKPTLKGFEECLQKSGVVVGGKVVPGAIYPNQINERFPAKDSGQLLFLSHGPSSPIVKAKYGSFEHVNGCDHYEAAHPQIKVLLSSSDAERQRLQAEAEKLKECKPDEYHKVADFLEKYEGFSSELSEVRDRLILEAAKKAALNITEGKYTDEDLKVLADFERYIVQPKIDLAIALYEEALELEGDAKKAKQAELKAVLAQISALNQKPYFLAAHVQKLINDGKFEEAETMNSIKLVLENHQRLGAMQNNVLITPGVASRNTLAAKQAFKASLPDQIEQYEYKTGQKSGKAAYYAGLASALRTHDTPVRTQNYHNKMREAMADIQQPNGYCYKYWRNTQKCVQETIADLQRWKAELDFANGVDEERAKEYDALAAKYSALETQGRSYIAAQNGEAVPEQDPTIPATNPQPQTNTGPTASTRTPDNDNGMYTFNFNQGNQQYQQQGYQQQGYQQYQQQAQMTPYNYQYPMSPYQNQNMFQQQNPYQYQPQQQYNPWLGQQSYGMQAPNQYGYQAQGSYNFNWGGGMNMGMQQNPYMSQQQQGYWQQPYQAYSMYSMYGR